MEDNGNIEVFVRVLDKEGAEIFDPESRQLTAEDFFMYMQLEEILRMFERRMIGYFLAGKATEERKDRKKRIWELIRNIPGLPNTEQLSAIPEEDERWMLTLSMTGECSNDFLQCFNRRCVNGVCQRIS